MQTTVPATTYINPKISIEIVVEDMFNPLTTEM